MAMGCEDHHPTQLTETGGDSFSSSKSDGG